MTYQKAIKLLRHHQKWRLGSNIKMLEPKVITEAIDAILYYFEPKYTKDEILAAAEMGEVNMHDARHVVSLLNEVKRMDV